MLWYNMHIIQWKDHTNINGKIWHTIFSRLGLMCTIWVAYGIFNGVSYISHSKSFTNNKYSNLVSQNKWMCWDVQLLVITMGRKRDVMETEELQLQVTQVLVWYHRDDFDAVRICCLYCRLSPCIQNLRRGVSSSLAPITCISFFVSSAVLLPPALVNLNLTFTLLQWQRYGIFNCQTN